MLEPVLAWVFASATATAGDERLGVHEQHHGQDSRDGVAPHTHDAGSPRNAPTRPLQPPADAVQPFASGAARRWRRRCPETCPVAVRECPSTGSFVALPRTAANVHDSSDSHTSATPAALSGPKPLRPRLSIVCGE